jgi:hypothetical protein
MITETRLAAAEVAAEVAGVVAVVAVGEAPAAGAFRSTILNMI